MEGWAGLNERREGRGELNYSVHEEPPSSDGLWPFQPLVGLRKETIPKRLLI